MDDRDDALQEAIQQIAALAEAYLRLRLESQAQKGLGSPETPSHKQFLFRRIAWRIQANAEGGLSERAPSRARDCRRR